MNKFNFTLPAVLFLTVLNLNAARLTRAAQPPVPRPQQNQTAEPQRSGSSSGTPKIEAIVTGSACPQKHPNKTNLPIESNVLTVPLDYDVNFTTNGRKTCQSRLTFKPVANKRYEIKEISQTLLFTLREKSAMTAEISFGVVGDKDFKIDDTVKDFGEQRRILTKKLINYGTPCGQESVFRIQTDVNFTGEGANSFKSDPLALTVELKDCEPLTQ